MLKPPPSKQSRAGEDYTLTGKWGELVAARGHAQIPMYLLRINQFLDKDHQLTPIDQLVLFQLVGNWWNKSEMPFPAISTLAHRIGVSSRQISRCVSHLVELGLMEKKLRKNGRLRASNQYDLTPLVKLLEEIAAAYPNEFPRATKRKK